MPKRPIRRGTIVNWMVYSFEPGGKIEAEIFEGKRERELIEKGAIMLGFPAFKSKQDAIDYVEGFLYEKT